MPSAARRNCCTLSSMGSPLGGKAAAAAVAADTAGGVACIGGIAGSGGAGGAPHGFAPPRKGGRDMAGGGGALRPWPGRKGGSEVGGAPLRPSKGLMAARLDWGGPWGAKGWERGWGGCPKGSWEEGGAALEPGAPHLGPPRWGSKVEGYGGGGEEGRWLLRRTRAGCCLNKASRGLVEGRRWLCCWCSCCCCCCCCW